MKAFERIALQAGVAEPDVLARAPRKGRPQATTLEPLQPRVVKFEPLVFDIESKAGPGQEPGFVRPFLIGLYDGESFLAFRNDPKLRMLPWRKRHLAPGGCVDSLMTVLLHRYRGRTVYAHNGGGFDMLFLFAWIRRHPELAFEVVPVQSSILRVDVWYRNAESPKKERVTFLDSMRLFPKGLDDACASFGVQGKIEHDLAMAEDDPCWDAYLEGDCVALRAVLLQFHELISGLGGEVATTTPATAMKLFRLRFLANACVPSIQRHGCLRECSREGCRGCLHRWIRKGYKGGRVEIFEMQGKNLHYYDFNSSYPAVLLLPMPVGAKTEAYGEIDWKMRDSHVGFAECEVYIPPACHVPPLPFERDGKLIFPTGQFSGVWNIEELALLQNDLVKGKILSVRRVVWYEAAAVFEPMIRMLYKFRQRCGACSKTKPDKCSACGFDIGMSELAKLLMNAFYGKFGMDPDREKILHVASGTETPRGWKPAWHAGDPTSVLTSEVGYAPEKADADYIVPQIAAHVTALARIALWKEMAKIVSLGGKLFYVDTDAELVDKEIVSSNELGAMKDEYPGETLTFQGLQPKAYMVSIDSSTRDAKPYRKFSAEEMRVQKEALEAFEKLNPTAAKKKLQETEGRIGYEQVKFKGVQKKLRNRASFEKLAAGGTVSYRNLGKVRTLAAMDFFPTPTMRTVEKSMKSAYDKRVVLPDGGTRAVVLDGNCIVEPGRFADAGV